MRSLISFLASRNSPAIWAVTPRTCSAFERPVLSAVPSVIASASWQSLRASSTPVRRSAIRARPVSAFAVTVGSPMPADREGVIVERERAIVIASPERQEARLEQGLSARRVRAIRRRQSTIGPLGTFLQPLRRHPKRRERAREAERLVRPPFIDEPSERSEQFAVSLLDLERGGL